MCVCVFVLYPSEAPLDLPSQRLGYAIPAPQAISKDPVIIYTCGSTWVYLFRLPPPHSLLKCTVCNSKGHLRPPRFGMRTRLDTLRFCSGIIGSTFAAPFSLSRTFSVLPCQDSLRGCLWTESAGFLGFHGLLAPLACALVSETPSSTERSGRPRGCRRRT